MIAKTLRQIAALLGLALLPAFVSGAIQLRPGRAERAEAITPAELLTTKQEIIWVDARPPKEFAAGHAAKALPLNPGDWDRLIPPFLDAWFPEKLVVVYGEPEAAETVAKRMREELRMNNVRVLKGGWKRWKEK